MKEKLRKSTSSDAIHPGSNEFIGDVSTRPDKTNSLDTDDEEQGFEIEDDEPDFLLSTP